MPRKELDAFPRGVELVVGVIVENGKGELLLAKSPKWKNKWSMPGGHVEPGEKIFDALVREGKEETGLKLKPIGLVCWGELISSTEYDRKAHIVYLDFYCKVIGGKLKLDSRELTEWKWLKPKEALKQDLAKDFDKTIKEYMAYKRGRRSND